MVADECECFHEGYCICEQMYNIRCPKAKGKVLLECTEDNENLITEEEFMEEIEKW